MNHDIEHQVVLAAQLSTSKPLPHGYQRCLDQLLAVESSPGTSVRPSQIIARKLDSRLWSLYEDGWQPADVAHLVKRYTSVKGLRLIVAMIAAQARAADAAKRAPQAWLEQLEDLGAYDPTRAAIVGGHDNAFGAWARAERLYLDEQLDIGVQVLGQVLTASPQPLLMDPPSRWPASNRGVQPRPAAGSGPADARVLSLIRALLAKAEATTFEAEAETFTAKAQEMMTRHSIDVAMLAARRADGTTSAPGVVSRRVHIDAPYADEKATFLAVIAEVNGVHAIWSPWFGSSTLTGFPVDLQLTELLFTSLLVQAQRSSADATSVDRRMRTASFRRAFLVSFALRIGERLESTRKQVSEEAASQYGAALVPVLADRQEIVANEAARLFPNAGTMKARRYNSAGWHAGRAAADRADIGQGEQLTAG